jgi:hypothetical protein
MLLIISSRDQQFSMSFVTVESRELCNLLK